MTYPCSAVLLAFLRSGALAGSAILASAALGAQADWYTDTVLPKARAVHAAVYDAAAGQVVLFGGNTNAGVQGDTWLWSSSRGWSKAAPANSPSPRREHAMAYDLTRGETVLFGGWDGSQVVGDTWIWNGTDWRMATPGTSPSPRMAEMAFDPVTGNVILFGGQDAAGLRQNDTWSWDGRTWTQLAPSLNPPARIDHAMVEDWSRSQILMHGGWDSGFLGDTWIWNGRDWVAGPLASPPPRSEHKMAFVPNAGTGGDVILFSGDSPAGRTQDTWRWDGRAWTQLSPPQSPSPREEHVFVGGFSNTTPVMFGGWDPATGHVADHWTFANGQWRPLTLPQPIGAGTAAMDYDPNTRQSILFGGFQDQQVSDQTWSYGSGNWTRLFPATAPPPRAEPAMAYDRARREFVLFGGANGSVQYNDTWVFRGGNWTQLNPATVPPARWGHAMVFDETRGTVLMFSGRLGGGSSNLTDTWEWNGTDWTQLVPATVPPGREDHSMSYDPGRGATVMFGGWVIGTGFSNETWELRAGNWVLLTPPTSPTPRSEQMMAYDRTRGCIVMFGGQDASGRVADTWEFEGDWRPRTPAHAPEAREEGVMVFDESAGEIVLAVGWDLGHFTDTWHYGTRPPALAVAYGSGCQGSTARMPVLTADRPWLGTTAAVMVAGIPSGAPAILAFGFGQTSIPLAPFGMPGCTALTQPLFTALMVTNTTVATTNLTLPASPTLVGVSLDLQGYAFAPGANQAGVINSNGVELRAALK